MITEKVSEDYQL